MMPVAHVIDTNVLIVASAADDQSPFQPESTPVEEARLRKIVHEWLAAFQDSDRSIVLDYDWKICGEYQNKMSPQDYGWLVVLNKYDLGQTVGVLLDMDRDGHAVLPSPLSESVNDLADRKMVAAVLNAGGRDAGVDLVNACDTDWHDCHAALAAAGVDVHQLLPEWCEERRRRRLA